VLDLQIDYEDEDEDEEERHAPKWAGGVNWLLTSPPPSAIPTGVGFRLMSEQRWLRIIPVALVMYTISYVDRTNVSLALDPEISSMMKDLVMDDRMKGEAAGIFFFGYVLLQIPGGHWATRWSARKLISLFLIAWGLFAVGCGFSRSFREFEVMRFLLGAAESGVFPATMVLLANWFPRDERARANAFWTLCQPLAVVASAPFTAWLLGHYGWQRMMMLEGLLPFLWLPFWWGCIRDHPREAKWLAHTERDFLESTLQKEANELAGPKRSQEAGRAVPSAPSTSAVACSS
jgi:MFS family permease